MSDEGLRVTFVAVLLELRGSEEAGGADTEGIQSSMETSVQGLVQGVVNTVEAVSTGE